MPIKDSGKLSQLYAKYSENRKRIERKIGIEQLHLHDKSPNNLCGYIDLGFEVQCMDKSKIQNGFYEFDYTKISRYLKEKCGAFSISKVGQTKVITIGEMKANGEMSSLVLPEAAMNNFMVLMADGSAKFRICLFADDKGKVDLSLTLVSKIRKAVPDIALTSDVIVGFPGETEEEFYDTLSLIREVRFDNLFTFIYSPRKGTKAALMNDPRTYEEKLRNFNELLEVQTEICREANEAYLNHTYEIIDEGLSKNNPLMRQGRTTTNKVINYKAKTDVSEGDFVTVRVTEVMSWSLVGEQEC